MKELLQKYWFVVVFTLMICSRFFHFGDEIDSPHAWRQSDTAQYIDSFAKERISLSKPSVAWMGSHKTLILEFPLPEAMVAVLYKVFGEHLFIARLFFLFFFTISAIFFYKILKLFFQDKIPEIATIIFTSVPLALFYSRAIHIDFFALAFAHGMLYYFLKGTINQHYPSLIIGTCLGTIAFLVKVPYAFFLFLPLLVVAFQENKLVWLVKHFYIAIVPASAFLIWNSYKNKINAETPEYTFIPNYNRFTDMWYWYFGPWAQRSVPELWSKIYNRITLEVAGVTGYLVAAAGLVLYPKNKSYVFGITWLIGSLIYLVVFFNLNQVHNYYQIPFIAPLSLLMAIGIVKIQHWLDNPSKKITWMMGSIGMILLLNYHYAEKNYYIVNEDQIAIGNLIKEHSSQEDIIIITYGGLSPQCPNILYQAERYGWSIPYRDLTPSLVYQLWQEEHVDQLYIVNDEKPGGELGIFYDAMPNGKVHHIKEHNLTIFSCDLNFEQ